MIYSKQIFVITLLAVSSLVSGEETTQSMTASTPTIDIALRQQSRVALQMPELEYQFRIDNACNEGATLQSILVSVADTRAGVGDVRPDAVSNQLITLKIPSRQIAPLVVENFCWVEGSTLATNDSLLVRSILHAQTALTCVSEGASRTVYTSTGLDVRLRCLGDAPTEDPPAAD